MEYLRKNNKEEKKYLDQEKQNIMYEDQNKKRDKITTIKINSNLYDNNPNNHMNLNRMIHSMEINEQVNQMKNENLNN